MRAWPWEARKSKYYQMLRLTFFNLLDPVVKGRTICLCSWNPFILKYFILFIPFYLQCLWIALLWDSTSWCRVLILKYGKFSLLSFLSSLYMFLIVVLLVRIFNERFSLHKLAHHLNQVSYLYTISEWRLLSTALGCHFCGLKLNFSCK